jgi:omega-amidase
MPSQLVHLVQFDIVWEDKQANHARVLELIKDSRTNPGDLIVLPELFDVGFTLNTDIAIDSENTTYSFLQTLSDSTGCTVHGSRALQSSNSTKAINCATITTPGLNEPLCEYSKIHPFSHGRESESYIGGQDIQTYQWQQPGESIQVCPAICYDLRFPELFRLGVKKGAQAFVLGANWPSPRIHHWRALSIARAIENQSYMIAVNRTGNDPHLPYPGSSLVVSPSGEVLGELNDEEAVLSVEILPQSVTQLRSSFRFLDDIKLI